MSDLTGQRFGKLVVQELSPRRASNGAKIWICLCDCDVELSVKASNLTSGNTKSCGCAKKEAFLRMITTHGLTSVPEYDIWVSMKQRCTNPDSQSFVDYGGRGILLCDRWMNSFENFYLDMGPRPGSEYTIEREDVNGHYEPTNCIWATRDVQANNRRNNVYYEFEGQRLTPEQVGEKAGVHPTTIARRLARGLTIEEAISGQAVGCRKRV